MLTTELIEGFLEKLSRIKHLGFIRFGSRIPVTFPDRILDDDYLLRTLRKFSTKEKRLYIVTHFNHPRELTKKSINAVDRLIESNVIVNNQTPILKRVNDNHNILAELLNNLVNIEV